MRILDFDGRVVHQNSHRKCQAAEGHHIDRLAEHEPEQIEVRIESGIEMQTISVLRQLPRNSRIISAVRNGRDVASRSTSLNRVAHEDRLVE